MTRTNAVQIPDTDPPAVELLPPEVLTMPDPAGPSIETQPPEVLAIADPDGPEPLRLTDDEIALVLARLARRTTKR